MSTAGAIPGPGAAARAQLFDCRDAYALALEELAASDERVCAVASDSLSSAKLAGFKSRFPDRLVNVGIAEQDMVGVGSGLANGGMLPYLCGASCFLTARAMEQIKVDVAYSNVNVKLCAMSPGMAYGPLGPTHHSLEDLAWMRVLPNLAVVVPADPVETAAAMRDSIRQQGPMFLRISRMPVPRIYGDDYTFKLGKAVVLREGSDVTLVANGVLVCQALEAARLLCDRNISARVLNMATLKPLDREAILDAARTTRGIVTAEEAFAAGGLGGAVAEVLALEHPTPMRILGVPDRFAPTGRTEFLLEHFGLSARGIATAALELLHYEA